MQIEFAINNENVQLEIEPDDILVSIIREKLGLTGTKIGCSEGECGACTVLLDGLPVNSCLIPAAKVHQREITTIEGIGNMQHPHPLQIAIAQAGGSQCGYCSPGIVVSVYALLQEDAHSTQEDVIDALTGNLCRCTGYNKILSAVLEASK
jgi:aerobic-type carbon monoxide dehydrogenase small subunit (CoxS/CutS family)